jgi:hypothetical protein
MGNYPNDNQWKQQTFSQEEMDLFKDLDTTNLQGTTVPSINRQGNPAPNPFLDYTNLYANLDQPLNGTVLVKYVLANSDRKAVYKAALRVPVQNVLVFPVTGNFRAGKYRLYFTYSALGNEHFFKSSGNIQKQ